MAKFPDSLAIACWITGSCWGLALLAYLLDVAADWMLPLVVLGVITGVAEWTISQNMRN
jgi:hypothetical protein